MNAGKDVRTLMREITLPEHLEVGQGYGKVSWDVRAIWENYSGWFHHRSTTELYPVGPDDVSADLVELAGADALVARAQAHLDAGPPGAGDPPRRDRHRRRSRPRASARAVLQGRPRTAAGRQRQLLGDAHG